MKKLILPIMLLIAYTLNGQVDSTASPLTFTGYAEVYYAYDFNHPDNHERPSFFYNFNRHNEVNLNLGFINANYTTSNLRGNLGLMVGTWAQYNSSAEQGLLKNVWQANVGVKLCKEKNFWLDA
ncbi:MAG: outer membrane beta-barrel protein, partial [Saprospiraceae bacterium]